MSHVYVIRQAALNAVDTDSSQLLTADLMSQVPLNISTINSPSSKFDLYRARNDAGNMQSEGRQISGVLTPSEERLKRAISSSRTVLVERLASAKANYEASEQILRTRLKLGAADRASPFKKVPISGTYKVKSTFLAYKDLVESIEVRPEPQKLRVNKKN